jgi:hypothetical protein
MNSYRPPGWLRSDFQSAFIRGNPWPLWRFLSALISVHQRRFFLCELAFSYTPDKRLTA